MALFTSPLYFLISLGFSLLVLAIVISIHEAAHALAASLLGDNTAKYSGRLTLNPFAHIDLFGTLALPAMLIVLGLPTFGWAKPTPFNPLNLQNPKRDAALIALAGPAANLMLAFIISLGTRIIFKNDVAEMMHSTLFTGIVINVVILNITLAVFNLIPVNPLDGFKVIGGILPDELAAFWYSLASYGPIILLFLLFTPGAGFLNRILTPVTNTLLKLLLGLPISLY